MQNLPSDMLRYIRLRQRGDGGHNKSGPNKQVSLGQESVDEDDLHDGQLIPALQKVLRNRKKVLQDEFSYEPDDLELLQVECDHRSDLVSATMGGKGFTLRPANDGTHDRHWHILYEIGMTQCVLRGNRETCYRVRLLALNPCPTPHAIDSEGKWFFIKGRPADGDTFLERTGPAAYAALSAMLGLPARPLTQADLKSGDDVLTRLATIVRQEYAPYWLPELGTLATNDEDGVTQAARTIGRVSSADRLLVQANSGALHGLRRDSEAAWWLLGASQARPTRAGALKTALKLCGAEEGARIMAFGAPHTVGNDGKVAKWGQLHAHFVMTKNLLLP